MNDLKLIQSDSTPAVSFRKIGVLEITGKVLPGSEVDFWNPIRMWFEEYLKEPAKITEFRMQLDCLNTSSSKEILQMLYRLNELKDRGYAASVHWIYHSTDLDMLEVGHDYEHMVKVPFVFSALIEETLV
jgi:hypothetical protein